MTRTAGKTPVFRLLKRNGKVFVSIVPNYYYKKSLMLIIQGKILERLFIQKVLMMDCYVHYKIFHSNNEFAMLKSHVNGLEYYWNFAKMRLSKLMA